MRERVSRLGDRATPSKGCQRARARTEPLLPPIVGEPSGSAASGITEPVRTWAGWGLAYLAWPQSRMSVARGRPRCAVNSG
jgi:hypothetical protein